MRFYKIILILSAACLAFACARQEPKPSTPLETLRAYTVAVKRKDTTTMKLLLSEGSIKMAEEQARRENVTLDDVVKNEKLFTENPTRVEYRNEKIEGERATIEIRNASNSWDTVIFSLEEGVWKLDKQAMAHQMLQEFEQDDKRFDERYDEIFNKGRIP